MNMLDSYIYTTGAEWSHGRSGILRSDGMPHLDFSAPPEFSGEPGYWTPEHLLVASVVTCFTTTFMAIAEIQKLKVEAFKVNALARLEKVPGEGYRFTEITLLPEVQVEQAAVEAAMKVLNKTEKNCFITKSLKASIQVEPKFIPVFEVASV